MVKTMIFINILVLYAGNPTE